MSFAGAPIFVGKNHMYGADEKWAGLVEVVNEQNITQEGSVWDDTMLLVEPTSGAAFTAAIFLQTNCYVTPDLLFPGEERMLPVFSLYRSGNISQEKAEELFGDLKTAIAAPRIMMLLGLIWLLGTVICLCVVRQNEGGVKQ